MAKTPGVGDPAPDFELEGTDGMFRLSAHRGERVVLLFYPGDETPVCTRQFCSYRDDHERLDALDATIVGISGGDLDSHRAFIAKHDLTIPLLADTEHEVAAAYSAFLAPLTMTRRAVIIVDEHGTVCYRHDHRLGLDYQAAGEIEQALASLPRRART
jgi:thioredoxin-dependent peroxiredoxin